MYVFEDKTDRTPFCIFQVYYNATPFECVLNTDHHLRIGLELFV